MSLLELPASPPASQLTLSRLLANQWVETLRQTACLEVLLQAQAQILGAQTQQDPADVLQQLNAQVAASLKRLVATYGAAPELAAAALETPGTLTPDQPQPLPAAEAAAANPAETPEPVGQ